MAHGMTVRSVSFDTSFLLKNSAVVDNVVKQLVRDMIPCFITSTVVSELEQLKVWGRVTASEYRTALKRWKTSHAQVIDFKNRLFSDAFGKTCMLSMQKHMGVKPSDIKNDCSILVSLLKHGVDVFLSEDYHFTSAITQDVLSEVKNSACIEYHQMCDSVLYSIDSQTFLRAYQQGKLDIDAARSQMKSIKKSGKRLNTGDFF